MVTSIKTTTRQSNIEFVRIIAMTFIVTGHTIGHGMHGTLPYSQTIWAITVTGVNLFIIISGYFHIHLCWKSLVKLLGMVLFYSLLSMVVSQCIFGKITPTKDWIIPTLYPLSALFPMSARGYYWFISCYLMLMLLSPFINLVLNHVTPKQYGLLLGILIYLSCVSGWFFNNGINRDGFNTFHFLTMYVIGDSLHRYNIASKIHSYQWLIIYIIITITFPFITHTHPSKTLRYNNPFVIAASIAFVNIFINLKFQSNIINKIARSMFPTYLIQEGATGQGLYNLLFWYYTQNKGYWILPFYFIGLFALALIIEPLRSQLMKKPLNKLTLWFNKQLPIFGKGF
jgi:hypothetical protein